MNLYLISRHDRCDYDEYSDAIVAAKSEDEARLIHPSTLQDESWVTKKDYSSWVPPHNVVVQLVGHATKEIKKGVVCASFHAG